MTVGQIINWVALQLYRRDGNNGHWGDASEETRAHYRWLAEIATNAVLDCLPITRSKNTRS